MKKEEAKKWLKNFCLLKKEINKLEEDIMPKKYIEGFIIFEDLHSSFNNLYSLFEKEGEYSMLWEVVQGIEESGIDFNFNLLTEEQEKELTNQDGRVSIMKNQCKKYPNAIVKLKGLDEIVDYVIENYYEENIEKKD